MYIRFDRRAARFARAVAAVAGMALLAATPAKAESNTSAVCGVTFPAASISPPFKPLVLTPAEVHFPDAHAVIDGLLVPLEGDCVLTPLSKVAVTLAGTLVGI